MDQYRSKNFFVFIMSVLLAMVLVILPLPHWMNWFRPQWVFLVLIYWSTFIPTSASLAFVWIIGLLIDLLYGTLLGQNALTYVFSIYLVMRFHPQFRAFPVWQQTIIVFVVSLVNLALQYWIMALIGLHPGTWIYWSSAFTNAFVWPWLVYFMQYFQVGLKVVI